MVRQIRADALRLPPEVIDRWHQAGPMRVQREVVERLRALAETGELRLQSSELAALHFIALITIYPYAAAPADPGQAAHMVRAGVAAFLTGYGNRPPRR